MLEDGRAKIQKKRMEITGRTGLSIPDKIQYSRHSHIDSLLRLVVSA
jgi:hypothetical protein